MILNNVTSLRPDRHDQLSAKSAYNCNKTTHTIDRIDRLIYKHRICSKKGKRRFTDTFNRLLICDRALIN